MLRLRAARIALPACRTARIVLVAADAASPARRARAARAISLALLLLCLGVAGPLRPSRPVAACRRRGPALAAGLPGAPRELGVVPGVAAAAAPAADEPHPRGCASVMLLQQLRRCKQVWLQPPAAAHAGCTEDAACLRSGAPCPAMPRRRGGGGREFARRPALGSGVRGRAVGLARPLA